jgi:hypothetical protein
MTTESPNITSTCNNIIICHHSSCSRYPSERNPWCQARSHPYTVVGDVKIPPMAGKIPGMGLTGPTSFVTTVHTSGCLSELMAAHHLAPSWPLLLSALATLDSWTATKRQSIDKTVRTSKRQKNASAGNRTRGWPTSKIDDLEWQRPILPLNHQCLLMNNLSIVINILLSANAQGQTKTRGSSNRSLKRLGKVRFRGLLVEQVSKCGYIARQSSLSKLPTRLR